MNSRPRPLSFLLCIYYLLIISLGKRTWDLYRGPHKNNSYVPWDISIVYPTCHFGIPWICRVHSFLTLRRTREAVDTTPPPPLPPLKIYSTMLKLWVAVHSSFAEILTCRPCVHGNVIITGRSGQKSSISTFLLNLPSFFKQNGMEWFNIKFCYFLTF